VDGHCEVNNVVEKISADVIWGGKYKKVEEKRGKCEGKGEKMEQKGKKLKLKR
jgi:hypothetical protein